MGHILFDCHIEQFSSPIPAFYSYFLESHKAAITEANHWSILFIFIILTMKARHTSCRFFCFQFTSPLISRNIFGNLLCSFGYILLDYLQREETITTLKTTCTYSLAPPVIYAENSTHTTFFGYFRGRSSTYLTVPCS